MHKRALYTCTGRCLSTSLLLPYMNAILVSLHKDVDLKRNIYKEGVMEVQSMYVQST